MRLQKTKNIISAIIDKGVSPWMFAVAAIFFFSGVHTIFKDVPSQPEESQLSKRVRVLEIRMSEMEKSYHLRLPKDKDAQDAPIEAKITGGSG